MTLRTRVTSVAVAAVTVVLVAGSWLLVSSLRTAMTQDRDATARARAQDVAVLAAREQLPDPLPGLGDDRFAQVVDSRGAVLSATSPRYEREPVIRTRPAGDRPRLREVKLRDGPDVETYRIWALRQQTPDGSVVVYVGTSQDTVTDVMLQLERLLLVGVPLLVALLGAVTWVLVGRVLRPVEQVRREVATITDLQLDRRVPLPGTEDEIHRLAVTMNDMLARLETSSRRQRAFVADASHELQSPLASLRTQLEVSLVRPESNGWLDVAKTMLDDVSEMERLLRDLLFLAREDEGGPELPSTLVDLDDVVLEEVARVRSHARVGIDTTGVSAAPVDGRREELSRLVRNLLDNAARHGASQVWVAVSEVGEGAVELCVADDGPGIPVDQRQRVFERFVRLDDARRRGGGTGLGLAIVAAVARGHGGGVSVADSERGARVVVRLPVCAPVDTRR